MSRPANAKYCPRCTTMNFTDALVCRHCGHQFRTGQEAPPPEAAPTDAELHRTQMFSLPPLPQRAAPSPDRGGNALARARLWTSLVTAVRSPLVLTAGVMILMVVAMMIAAAKFGVIGR